jgi:dUTP pyrophosphatase
MHNQGEHPIDIKHGDSIAQLVFAQVSHPRWYKSNILNDTERGSNGFGSTDKK